MGEATANRRRHKDILSSAKGCIYCAEKSPASQIDHMPPRSMFRLNQRPKGLEFPSCAACNQGTSKLDVVATFMARTYPGIADAKDDAEWDRVLREINRVAPQLLTEMMLPQRQMQQMLSSVGVFDPRLAAFRADGPVLSAHMQAFAAKIGFALHYEATGLSVADTGMVQVRWFTSHEIAEDYLPSSLYEDIGEIKIMKQGKITSKSHFEYGWGEFSSTKDVKLYYAKVRESFAVAAFVVENEAHLPFAKGELATFRPGDLKETPHDRVEIYPRKSIGK